MEQPVPRWFAIRVKSRFEKAVASAIRHRGFDEFLPLCRSRHQWSDRLKSVEAPLFPGYVFCKLSAEKRLPLLTIPGVLHFVGLGKIPVPIEDREIGAIREAVRSGLEMEPWPFAEVGRQVRLGNGPLNGVEGFLVKVNEQHRVVVNLTLLRRAVAVDVQDSWVDGHSSMPR
jgi:transcription antitermination factor NusG